MKVAIKSFEPFHIGLKFKLGIETEKQKENLKKKLKSEGFEIANPPPDVYEGILLPPRELIAKKDDVRIELNLSANAINSVGTIPDKVIEAYKILLKKLKEIGFDLKESVEFVELIAVAVMDVGTDVKSLFSKKIELNSRTLATNGHNLSLIGTRFRSDIKEKEVIDLRLEPNPRNPFKEVSARFLWRTVDLNKIEGYSQKIDKILKEVISLFRGAR